MALATTDAKISVDQTKGNYLFPLILVTSLFFLWGLAYGLLDVLNKHFQELLNITKTRSTLLQAAYFGAYFLIALPAGLFMNKYGYKKGISPACYYILQVLCYSFLRHNSRVIIFSCYLSFMPPSRSILANALSRGVVSSRR